MPMATQPCAYHSGIAHFLGAALFTAGRRWRSALPVVVLLAAVSAALAAPVEAADREPTRAAAHVAKRAQSRVRLVFAPRGTAHTPRDVAEQRAARISAKVRDAIHTLDRTSLVTLWLDFHRPGDRELSDDLRMLRIEPRNTAARLVEHQPIIPESLATDVADEYGRHFAKAFPGLGNSPQAYLDRVAEVDPVQHDLYKNHIPSFGIAGSALRVEPPNPRAYVDLLRYRAAYEAFAHFHGSEQKENSATALLYAMHYRYQSNAKRDVELAAAIAKAVKGQSKQVQLVVRSRENQPTLLKHLRQRQVALAPEDVRAEPADERDWPTEIYDRYANAVVLAPNDLAPALGLTNRLYDHMLQIWDELRRQP